MLKCCAISLIVCILSLPLKAQKGTAPAGYYPENYYGAIFTGALESAASETQEFTLVFTKGQKSERFVGRLESACAWKDKAGTLHVFNVSDLSKGTVLTAFYIKVTKKSDGQKSTENTVFALSFAESDGKKIPDDKRITVFCSKEQSLRFKVY
ncbi:MAG: hypothetical protein LAN71_05380 [Acidobacteriia bacterium]|nr:hypothetical protein [Terriglobia bacterium]